MNPEKKSNRLAYEKSPYLLQHAYNPVEWYPWDAEAFEKAKNENKPIFLSIGYSTCHWCHVMERESFENEHIAELMNKNFINIKVDREERPDVDKIYMSAVQTMMGSGGWPLSVFLTPDLKPFYGGTYFPPRDAHGRPGFPTVLQKISEVWSNEKEDVINSGEELLQAISHRHAIDSRYTIIDDAILKRTYHQIAAGYDLKFAGFGSGPKFPRPVVLNFLFRYYYRTKENEALKMALTTLMAMASGGMIDHLGGGFHRYSVDGQWRVPHFEKMLYDQAQLIHSYVDAYQITGDKFFATVAKETCDYALRDMSSPNGGFYSAEDADSFENENSPHKKEGAFYVWEKPEIEKILTEEEAKIFCYYYSVEEKGNVRSDPHNEFSNKNILFAPFTVEETAKEFSLPIETTEGLLFSAKKKLLNRRVSRPRPLCDDKILAGWNGLMIGALSRAARVLRCEQYGNIAVHSAQFVMRELYNSKEQTLLRRFRNGEAKFEAHLDDYAFMINGLLELHRTTFDVQWLKFAVELQGTQTRLFWDSSEGGFFDFSGSDKSILVRTKEAYDGAEPSGNAVAISNLLQLYFLTEENSFKRDAEQTLKYFCALIEQTPQVAPQIMCGAALFILPPEHLVLVIEKNNEEIQQYLEIIERRFLPFLNILVKKEDTSENFTPFLQVLKRIDNKVTAYLCRNFTCEMPITNPKELVKKFN